MASSSLISCTSGFGGTYSSSSPPAPPSFAPLDWDAAATEVPNPPKAPVDDVEDAKEKVPPPPKIPPPPPPVEEDEPKIPPLPEPKENVGAVLEEVAATPPPKENVGAVLEKTPLLVSLADDAAAEAAGAEEEDEAEKIPPPPLPKENKPAFWSADDIGVDEDAEDAAAAAAVVEVVKVSVGFSPEEETQKEKVGFIEELQLLVGARAWDKLEKEKVWFVLIAENEAKWDNFGLSSPPSPASSPSFLARSLESISLSEASRPRAADWEGVVQVNRVLVAEYVSEEWSEA